MTADEQSLAAENIKLVYYVAYKLYRSGYLPFILFDDAVGEVMFALAKAATVYDATFDCKFSTFAIASIRNQILYMLRGIASRLKRQGASLDAEITDRSGKTLAESIPADDDTEAEAVDWLRDHIVDTLKHCGKGAEAEILLENLNGRTMESIANERGVTKQRISSQIRDAKAILRTRLSRNDWISA
jgi:RNA polymerase sigma factor (sigma-70 family)